MSVTFHNTIAYVPEPAKTAKWFSEALGIAIKFVHDSGEYAELDTGAVVLAFAAESLGDTNFPGEFQRHRPGDPPLGTELGFITKDVAGAVEKCMAAGAQQLTAPITKPWGQTVAFLRDPNGILFEVATPIG